MWSKSEAEIAEMFVREMDGEERCYGGEGNNSYDSLNMSWLIEKNTSVHPLVSPPPHRTNKPHQTSFWLKPAIIGQAQKNLQEEENKDVKVEVIGRVWAKIFVRLYLVCLDFIFSQGGV